MSIAPLKFLIEGPDGCGKSVIIKHLISRFKANGYALYHCVTTTPNPDCPGELNARTKLIAKDSTVEQRLIAALTLYHANMKRAEERMKHGDWDLILIERGFSGFLAYNRIEWLDIKEQAHLIPNVDHAIFISSGFEELTERIQARNKGMAGNVPHQDSDLEYRKEVFDKYASYFNLLAEVKEMDKARVVYNYNGRLEQSTTVIYDFITGLVNAHQKR